MPCQCDIQEDHRSVEYQKVLALLKELKTGKLNLTKFNSGGYTDYDDDVLDKSTKELCGKLSKVKDIRKYTPEMQIWWREHQAADLRRKRREAEKQAEQKLKQQALAKLTTQERKALGV